MSSYYFVAFLLVMSCLFFGFLSSLKRKILLDFLCDTLIVTVDRITDIIS